MMECSLLGWLNFIVLTATGAVIAWYTWETRRLRQESQQEFSFPRLRVTIAAPATPDQSLEIDAYLDSGATQSFFQGEFAPALGLELLAGAPRVFQPTQGPGIETRLHNVLT